MKLFQLLILLVILLQERFIGSLNGQILNGDFSSSTIGCNNDPDHWTSNNDIQITDYFQPGNHWMDITGCTYGNGNWIEQKLRTSPGMFYKIQLDIGTWWGWDVEDAGVDVTINGIQLGPRCFNDSFTKSFVVNLHWETATTCYFKAIGSSTVIRFTGHGLCSKFSPPSACINPNPGVIAIDNIHFSDSFYQQKIYNLCEGENIKIGSQVYGQSGDFMDTLDMGKGCQTIIPFHINVKQRSYSTQNYYLCAGDTIKVGTHIFNTSGIFSDTFTGYNGCDSIIDFNVNYLSESECKCNKPDKIPNVFSPDNDHVNDYFPDVFIENMLLSIYDRWGLLVYSSDNGKGWDGKKCDREFATGTYFYFIDYSNCKNEKISSHGVLTLIR